MKSIFIIFVIISISAINCRAMLNVRNPQMSNLVARAETLRNEGNYFEAADYYLDAINIKNPIAQQELKENKFPDKSPYCLRLHLIRLLCLENSIDKSNSAQLKRYNNALKVLAIKQPVKNTETISFIINKINKK